MLLLTFIAVVVAICAAMAAFGFRGRINTVGVDLGTTFSVVGIIRNGKVEIITDKQGRNIFPSMVSFRDTQPPAVGYSALELFNSEPLRTIYNAKRFIGRSLEEPETQEYALQHSFKVVPHETAFDNHIAFEIPMKNGSSSLVTPVEIGTNVLKHLKSLTAEYLGYDHVSRAIIAVPAKFTDEQRAATGAAYAAAGLKVMRVIEEPTAAAVAYGLHKKSGVSHVLVYDFGGGTLDVSILYVASGSVQVYATDGDDALGGSDFDVCIASHLRNKILEAYGEEAIGDAKFNDDAENICSESVIHSKAESIKKVFTTDEEVSFSCTHANSKKELTWQLNRDTDFHVACDYLFDRSLLPVTRLLSALEMSVNTIDEVVLVGGSTRIPKVKSLLKEYFQRELNDRIDPDITVAYGAASIQD